VKGEELGSQLEAIEQILRWVRDGREIIPLVGAGISIESGIPPMAAITRYLAKTQAYIHYRVFRDRDDPPIGQEGNDHADDHAEPPRRDPYTYLSELGWPDPGELDTDLWYWLKRFGCSKLKLPEATPHLWMDLLVEHEILRSLGNLDSTLVAWLSLLSRRPSDRGGGALARLRTLDPDLVERLEKAAESDPAGAGEGRLLRLQGSYWKGLLAALTRSDPDLVDALFQRLVTRRRPGSSHRFLALLTPQLRVRLILTLNFDQLIESALRLEGFRPAIYGVAGGAPLPHPALVQEDLSVVKLHGSAFGLLVGEQLDRPVDRETLARFRDYLPDEPVLLVLGVSGWDQRVIDMLDLVAEKHGDILWLHFEPDGPPTPVRRLERSKLQAVRVQNPGAFLQELYRHRSLSHPSCGRPLITGNSPPVLERRAGSELPEMTAWTERIIIFLDDGASFGLGATYELAELVAVMAGSYRTIWIDMEAMYTEDDLVVEVFSRLRQFDPSLPPEILPAERSSGSRKIRRRLFAAMSRGRYLIAFNAMGSFGRAPTQHHRREKTPTEEEEHFDKGIRFVTELIEDVVAEPWQLRDSIIAFAVDRPRCRTEPETALHLARMRPLLELGPVPGLIRRVAVADNGPGPDAVRSEDEKGLFLLSAFRRRRSHIAMNRLLPKVLQRDERPWSTRVAEQLKDWERRRLVLRVEGGDYWMGRGLRNTIYTQGEEPIRGSRLSEIRTAEVFAERIELFLRRIQVHAWIAGYYEERFSCSKETYALIELIYHRVSALRYLTRLSCCWWACSPRPAEPPAVDPTWTDFLDGQPLEIDRVDAIRLAWVRSLHGVFDRLRERLLRTVPGPALAEMVKWIMRHELGNFSRGLCLSKLVGIPGDVLRDGNVRPDGAIDRTIEQQVARLGELLDEIRCAVHVDRLEVENLVAARFGSPDAAHREDAVGLGPGWAAAAVEERIGAVIATLRADLRWNPEDEGMRRRFEALLEAAELSRFRCPEAGRNILGLIEEWTSPRTVSSGAAPEPPAAQAARVARRRLAADLHLCGLSPWDAKGWSLARYRRAHRRAEDALTECRLALAELDAIPGDGGTEGWLREPRIPFMSYLHSLMGRAHYLRGEFQPAFAKLDRSRGGLAESLETNRSALAASLLRLAECLMLRADQKIIVWCEEATATRRRGDVRDLSDEGIRKLGRDAGGRQTASSTEDVGTLLDQCISNWSDDLLKNLSFSIQPKSDSWTGVLRGAHKGLATAQDLLDQVERILEYSRRNLEWWGCLYQLRAQVEIERLLLTITGHPGLHRQDRSDEHRFIARFVLSLRRGLRSVRRGLDVLLPREGERTEDGLKANFLITRLLRQWVELMICGAYLTLFERHSRIHQIGDELWEQWVYHNEREGIVKLPTAISLESWFKGAHRTIPQNLTPSLWTRGRVLAAIAACMRDGGNGKAPGGAVGALVTVTCREIDGR
jgi:hypothetical protein